MPTSSVTDTAKDHLSKRQILPGMSLLGTEHK
jgi:hypothetical protein